ncbi:MAG TPA: redox-sensing transcriptional repressor Rex [Proteobacteria bacterium]|nr:redox-sensing transcriptional repressor Rex [bacterium BMS3Abin14]HDL53556.1 redox-sensing transcriptional repressor Rex [Pseudomonadota bacterium]
MVFKKVSRVKIPDATIRRLSLYDRCLEELKKSGNKIVSSSDIARKCGTNPAQIRKDFAYFGEFGVRGVGYYVENLQVDIKMALGIDRPWLCALVGAGNLGFALLGTDSLEKRGFKISAIFEKDPILVEMGSFQDIPLFSMEMMSQVISDLDIHIGLIAVNPDTALKVAHNLIDSGIKGILNFTPATLKVPPGIVLKNVDFAIDLEGIAFQLSNQ